MDPLVQELTGGIPNFDSLVRIVLRLTLAALFAGVIGWERRRSGHSAGLRTHMLVCLGATIFTLVAVESGASKADQSRVIQGIVTGIGFLGAGTILKTDTAKQVKGLTTAADIWVMAGIGTAVGAGFHALALLATIVTWFILSYLYLVEQHATATPMITTSDSPSPPPPAGPGDTSP